MAPLGDNSSEVEAIPHDEHSPVRFGRHTAIRPVGPTDHEWLFKTAMYSSAGSHWRLHGEVPTYERFLQVLFNGARASFMIDALDTTPLGMVQLWNVEPLSRNGQVTAFLAPEHMGKGWPLEGFALFADYCFRAFDLHKLYLETLDTELPQFESLVGPILRREGQLREHRYVFGRLVDNHILALYRDDFEKLRERVLPGVL